MNEVNELFVWKRTEDSEYQMWCYAGGRRYLFVRFAVSGGRWCGVQWSQCGRRTVDRRSVPAGRRL